MGLVEIELRNVNLAARFAHRGVVTMHVLEAIEGDVAGQRLKKNALRLEGVNHAAVAGQPGEDDGVRAIGRAGFNDGCAGPDALLKQLGFAFGKLAQFGE